MPKFGLYRTWYPHFMTSFTINDITCTIFFPSHALYMTTHLLCMMSHSLYVLHHTVTLSMVSNTICLCYIHLIWHQAQCYDHKTIVCLPSHAWHILGPQKDSCFAKYESNGQWDHIWNFYCILDFSKGLNFLRIHFSTCRNLGGF